MSLGTLRPDTLDRMVHAVEKVRERLLRSTAALEAAGVPYAVVGGHAVAAWVAQVDEGAVRNTRDVDLLLCRNDLDAAQRAMADAGFDYAEVSGVHLFRDLPDGKPSEGVHLLFAGEKVRPGDATPSPDMAESLPGPLFRLVTLEALLRMKLISFRDKDRTHIRDLIGVGLVDDSWPALACGTRRAAPDDPRHPRRLTCVGSRSSPASSGFRRPAPPRRP